MRAEPGDARRARIVAIIAGVLRQAVRDAGATAIVLPDDGSPEATLARECCVAAVGEPGVIMVAAPSAAQLERLAAVAGDGGPADVVAAEAHRYLARLEAERRSALLAHPVNKTALLLSARVPPEPLLPLGDLYASQVEALAGGWTAPPAVRELARRAGGVAVLDAALIGWLEERRELAAALARLPEEGRAAVRAALEAGRFARRHVGLVPKLSARTPGIDLFQ